MVRMTDKTAMSTWLRPYSKFVSLATLFLIFAGGMVTSTGSGLAVPDWPLSYGMLFPPMVGGVFYEHGHRLIAASVGFLTVISAFSIYFIESRSWVRKLGFFALLLVIFQGLLGGLTVLFLLPKPVSILHAVTGQTFFCTTLFIAYALSRERAERVATERNVSYTLSKPALILTAFVYLQLILGALMRHTHSGLAIYDFPRMAGEWIPSFNAAMLAKINAWRFTHDLPPATMTQVVFHFIHRAWAFVVFGVAIWVNAKALTDKHLNPKIKKTLFFLDVILLLQISLGVLTVWTGKIPIIASLHVVTGAFLLGICVILSLRSSPLKLATL
jgi:cytochrome c oxidase assembly protein subunit 15